MKEILSFLPGKYQGRKMITSQGKYQRVPAILQRFKMIIESSLFVFTRGTTFSGRWVDDTSSWRVRYEDNNVKISD